MRKRCLALTAGLFFAVAAQQASAAPVTTLDGSQGWVPSDVRSQGSVSIDANGLKLSSYGPSAGSSAQDKAGVAFTNSAGNLGTLGALVNGSLSFDFYRDSSSTVPGYLAPTFKLYFDNGGAGGTGSLTYEFAYNNSGANVTDDQWYQINLLNQNFWMRDHGTNRDAAAQVQTLNMFLGGYQPDPASPVLNANTIITGIEVSIGSGWAGSATSPPLTFLGYVNNLNVTFKNATDPNNPVTYGTTFEANAVPEPSTILTGGMAVVMGLAFAWRRRKSVAV